MTTLRGVVVLAVVATVLTPAAQAMHTAVELGRVAPLREAAWRSPTGQAQTSLSGAGVHAYLDGLYESAHPDLDECGDLWDQRLQELLPALLDPQLQAFAHGTKVAGVLCASGDASKGLHQGVAPNVGVLTSWCLRVTAEGYPIFACNELGGWYESYNLRVYSKSSGGDPLRGATNHGMPSDADVLYVHSAGNSGGDGSSAETDTHANQTDPRYLRVAAGNGTRGDVAGYSSRGDRDDPATWPHLTAPACMWTTTMPWDGFRAVDPLRPFIGEVDCWETTHEAATDPQSTWARSLPWYTKTLGTSLSAPFVAGVAALMFEVHSDLSAVDARYLLTRTADPFLPTEDADGDGTVSPEDFWAEHGYKAGYGYVNATRAVAAAHWLALHPDGSVEDAVACSTVGWSAEGRLVLNPGGGGCGPAVTQSKDRMGGAIAMHGLDASMAVFGAVVAAATVLLGTWRKRVGGP